MKLRFGDPQTVQQYPLPISGRARWSAEAGQWQCTLQLPDLAGDSLLLPSFSMPGTAHATFQAALEVDNRRYPLPPVPADRPVDDPSDDAVTTCIDYFHVKQPLSAPRLVIRSSLNPNSARHLLVVSARPVQVPPPLYPKGDVATIRPPPFSQMLENPRHARRICSPVSMAMALGAFEPHIDVGGVIRDCYDRATRMYGVWPLAVRAAASRGYPAAAELFDGWKEVVTCLERGAQIVASIRYAEGSLPGAPQRATAGHLVVVWGLESGQVLVNDPAAPDHGSVPRRYAIEALSEAWFRHRGAAYILAP